MVMRGLLLCFLIFAGPLWAQEQTPDADFDVRLELVLDPRTEAPLEGEMVLATIRGFYRETITNEDLKLRRMTDFDWIQLKPDLWTEQPIDGLPTVVFERRIALFPKRSGALTLFPIAHELELMNRANRRQKSLVRSDPLTLEVAAKPAGAGSDWLPVNAIEFSDTWSKDASILVDGENVERRVVLRALGVPPELLPKQPPLREPWLITFTPPEERSVQLTPEGPVSTVVWVWYLRPITGAPGVIPAVDIPYFDTVERKTKSIAIPASPIGYASFANNASSGWSSGFEPNTTLWTGFIAGLVIALIAGLFGRRVNYGLFGNARLWIARIRKLNHLRRLKQNNDIAAFRGRMSEFLTSETSLNEAQRLALTKDLDTQIFASTPINTNDALTSSWKIFRIRIGWRS